MTSTVDNINASIIGKIDNLQLILHTYDTYELGDDNAIIKNYLKQIEDIQATYECGSIGILKEYYTLCNFKKSNNNVSINTDLINSLELTKYYDNDSTCIISEVSVEPMPEIVHSESDFLSERNVKKQNIYNKFMKFIENENIISKIKRIYTYCTKLHKMYDAQDQEISISFKKYNTLNIDIEYNDKMYDVCILCKYPLVIEAKTSEFVCKKCGTVEKMYGVVFEDEQLFYQEGQRTKNGKYDPSKHCKFWVDRILARENIDDNKFKDAVKAVKLCRKRDNIRIEQLSCEMIRSYLKELHLTIYNDHVPFIRKKITNIEPAQLTDHELMLVHVYFSRVIQIFNRIKTSNKPNCPYHPYFIYKIIEQILKGNEHASRRKEILSNIHLQSRDTLIENDCIWIQIVPYISEFTYIPTEGR